jgi:hypothetical protein
MSKLYSAKFLRELESKSKKIDIVSYLINKKKMTFTEAILEIAEYLQMQPEYVDLNNKETYITNDDCLKALLTHLDDK